MHPAIVHKAWPCVGLALLLTFGLIPTGQAADNLSFKGNLVEEACTLRPGDEAITLELWDVTSKHLYINTRTQGKGFKVHLEDCDTSIGNTVTITLGGARKHGATRLVRAGWWKYCLRHRHRSGDTGQ